MGGSRRLGFALAFALASVVAVGACSLVLDTKCFEGECADAGQPDVVSGVDASDASDASALDTGPADAFDAGPCGPLTVDPCRTVSRGNGGCYCGTSGQAHFDNDAANPSCIYRCQDDSAVTFTDSVKYCPDGCSVELKTVDRCNSQPTCVEDAKACFATCTL